MIDVHYPEPPAAQHGKEREYSRTPREAAFEQTVESIATEREPALAALNRTGIVGAFPWAPLISPIARSAVNDPDFAWVEQMLDAHGGLARSARRTARA